jgi:hypothetical protein
MARRAKQEAPVASSRQKNQDLLVAICAESDEESARLKTYVAARGWRFADREYRPAEWRGILEDARKRRFNAVCASIEGLWWFAQVAAATDFQGVAGVNQEERAAKTAASVEAADETVQSDALDGVGRVIHTTVMSTSGVPVDIAIPLKPMTPQLQTELAHLLAQMLVKEFRDNPTAIETPSESSDPAVHRSPQPTKRKSRKSR